MTLDAARKELHRLGAVAALEERDPIESAINHILSVSDEAHYYAGLAFGLTLADLGGR